MFHLHTGRFGVSASLLRSRTLSLV